LTTILENFGALLNFTNASSLLESSIKALDAVVEDEMTDVQYRYDHVSDLVSVYNALRELLLEIQSECCPDIEAF
ncbi:MAG TPA: hypothetical protein DEB18_07600, partial [Leeuwenhoekiella sp.]|nr:hypothetical protein [Leeuwenhoekiella sp.]